MKIRVMFKTPDAVDYALDDEFGRPDGPHGSYKDEAKGDARAEAQEFLEKFIQYGENITVEFDTVAKTATVL